MTSAAIRPANPAPTTTTRIWSACHTATSARTVRSGRTSWWGWGLEGRRFRLSAVPVTLAVPQPQERDQAEQQPREERVDECLTDDGRRHDDQDDDEDSEHGTP